MSTVAGSAGPSPSRARMNIGEVLDRLRPDFPGITIPKIRFLEDKGLIKPDRTAAGYRKFWSRTWSGCATCCGCSATTTSRSG